MKHLSWVVALWLVACDDQTKDHAGADAADADTDTDADSDADTDGPGVIDEDGDGFGADVDCNDTDSDVFPGAPDLCGDDRVTNCDRTSDDGLVTLDGTTGFTELGDALAAAVDGSDLLLCAGTYTGTFEATVPVHLRSRVGADLTILSGDGGSTLAVPGGSEIVGLTIRDGGRADRGGGIRMTSGGTLDVEDCVVTSNKAVFGGGISVAPGAVATLVNTEVRGNTATDGGAGIEVLPGGTVDLSQGSTVTGNSAKWFGGGVWLDGATLIGGVVSGNEVTQDFVEMLEVYVYYAAEAGGVLPLPAASVGGGGVAAGGTARVIGTEITDNEGDGGGVAATDGHTTLVDSWVHGNEAHLGGGLLGIDATVVLEGTTELSENTAIWGAGGAIYGSELIGGSIHDNEADDDGGGLWITGSDVVGATIRDNVASSLGGGAVTDALVTLTGTTFSGNSGGDGGAIATTEPYYGDEDQHLVLDGCTLQANTGTYGGGIYAYSDVTLVDTQILDNSSIVGGGAMFLYVAQSEGGGGGESPPPIVAMTGGAVLRNTTDSGSGAVDIFVGELSVDGADFGAGADDNTPVDVATQLGGTFSGYDADAAFTCDDEGCTP